MAGCCSPFKSFTYDHVLQVLHRRRDGVLPLPIASLPSRSTKARRAPAMSETPTSKYSDLSREMLLAILQRQEAQRKFGLVWERPPAELDAAINEDFVALEVVPELSHGQPPFDNLIIEGDNFDVLRALRATHSGKVKVISIDPPYNTGNKDFVYNDRHVDREHKFRHSLWIEFMYQRLLLARDLLRDDGVIFVNIGEDEFAHLSMLMDQVFPGMKVGTFVWRTRQGANDSSGARFTQDHEYVLCYVGPRFAFGGVEKTDELYKNPDNDPRGPWRSDNITAPKNLIERPNSYFPVLNPATDVWYPCNPDRVWAFASESKLKAGQKTRTDTIEQRIRDGRILWPSNERVETFGTRASLEHAIITGDAPSTLRADSPDLDFWVGRKVGYGRPQVKRFWTDMRAGTKPVSSWMPSVLDVVEGPPDVSHITTGTTQEGTITLTRMMGGKVFDFPKPLSLVQGLLDQATTSDGGDIVLDFFAGSGTTAHAVLALNARDGGNRRFILASSTEATKEEPGKNLCRDVCRERVARASSGYQVAGKGKAKSVDGLGGSFAYLRAVRLPLETVSAKLQHQWVWTAIQLLHSESIQSLMPKKETKVLSLPDSDVVYVPEITDDAIETLQALFAIREAATVYSWRPGVLRQEFRLDGVTFEKIPDTLIARFGGRR
jgi:adenine-specific DNA-methyltransferase